MHFLKRASLFIFILTATLIVGCGPLITVENRTKIPVRVIVSSGGKSEVLSPSPGESSSAEAENGPYHVSVVPDDEWIGYAKQVRKYLNDQLADSDKLTGPQLLDVVRRLKDIAARMQQYENAGSMAIGCPGVINENGGGLVVVSIGADGKLVVNCK